MHTDIITPQDQLEADIIAMLTRFHKDRERLLNAAREITTNARADHNDIIIPRATYQRFLSTIATVTT